MSTRIRWGPTTQPLRPQGGGRFLTPAFPRLPVCDTFTQADGSDPDPAFWTRQVEGTAAIDIQGNKLSLRAGTDPNEGLVYLNIGPTGDQEFLGIVECDTDNTVLWVTLRASNFVNGRPQECYLLEFTGSDEPNDVPYLYRSVGGSGAGGFLAGSTDNLGAFANGERRWVRFQCFGTGATVTLRMRQWPVGDPEPVAWGIDTTDTHVDRHLSGVPSLVILADGRYLLDEVCYDSVEQASPPGVARPPLLVIPGRGI